MKKSESCKSRVEISNCVTVSWKVVHVRHLHILLVGKGEEWTRLAFLQGHPLSATLTPLSFMSHLK